MKKIIIFILILLISINFCLKKEIKELQPKQSLVVESPAFKNMDFIPKKYTCDGEDISPPLILKNLSKNAKAVAIIMEDPDAPLGTFTHWIIWNLEPAKIIPENIPREEIVFNNTYQGINDFNEIGYRGPCPPKGDIPHRYVFKVYVLNKTLDVKPPISKDLLLENINKYLIQYGELIGLYKR